MRGVVLGSDQSLKLVMTIFGANKDIPQQVAAEFEFFLTLPLYLDLDSMKLALHIKTPEVSGFKVTQNNAHIWARNYEKLFGDLFNAQLQAINSKFAQPIDLSSFDFSLQILAGYFTKTKISPYVQNGFLYAGFDFALENSAKWSDEDIMHHSQDAILRSAFSDLMSRRQ